MAASKINHNIKGPILYKNSFQSKIKTFPIQGAYLRSLKLVACLYNTVFPDKGNYAQRFLPQATYIRPSNTPPTLTYILKQQV